MQDSAAEESPQRGWEKESKQTKVGGMTWKAMERKVVNTKG